MKSLITYAFLLGYVLWTLVSCGPVAPATGIILDAPVHWQNGPDPRDTPETYDSPRRPTAISVPVGWTTAETTSPSHL